MISEVLGPGEAPGAGPGRPARLSPDRTHARAGPPVAGIRYDTGRPSNSRCRAASALSNTFAR